METQKPKVRVLSEAVIEKVLDESMTLLEKNGIIVEDADTLDILSQMGGDVAKGNARVRIKRDMVENAIASAPKSLTLHDLKGREKFTFGDGQIHFNPGSAALFIYDAVEAVMRPPVLEDLIRFSRLSDTLENIEATSTALVPSEVPEEMSDSIRLYISCLYSDKPVVTGTFSEKAFGIMRDLLVSRTGKESLRETPCAIFDVCPTSPLRWSELGCHDLRECAQNAIPVQFISMPLAGALAPMSLLASVVQHTAETISGVVIHQTWTPGSPFIYGGSPALFDMRHSTSPMGAVETLLMDIANAEVGKHLGFPTQAYLGMSDSKSLDAQAGMETAMTLAVAATGSVDFVSGPGMLNFESCQCLEKLVLDNNICGMVRRLKHGLEFRGKTLGMDAVVQGLEEGYYLTTEDTLRLYKEEAFYPSDIIDRKAFKQEGKVDAGRLVRQARDEIEQRLKKQEPPAVDDTILKDMKSVMEEALAPFGLESVAQKCLAARQ
jgi:trimethylamine--corrinoid protein Co-methyltransferase